MAASSIQRGAAITASSGLLLLLLAGRIGLLFAHVSLDPNEGWNGLQAARAMGAGSLYPPPGSLAGNNYPPFSFFFVGWAGKLTGDAIFAGRLVAIFSVLIVASLIVIVARNISGGRISGPLLGGAIFLGLNATLFRSYLGMDDPQWLGHALMMSALAVLIARHSSRRLEPWRIAAACLLMLAGGLTKQNLLAFPLATSIWLAAYDRRALTIWLVVSAASLLAVSCLLDAAYGGAVFSDVLASERHYSLWRMLLRSAGPILAMAPLIVITSTLLGVRGSDRRIELLLLLVAISLPLGILQRSGEGVDRNAHFEALIALSLATGVALQRGCLAKFRPFPRWPQFWLAATFLVLLPASLRDDVSELLHRRDREVAWTMMEDRVRSTPGRVACQTLAICYWAAKGFQLDFFLYGQRALSHGTAVLAKERFAAVVLDRPAVQAIGGNLANPVIAVVSRGMHPVFVDRLGHQLLVPDRGDGTGGSPG